MATSTNLIPRGAEAAGPGFLVPVRIKGRLFFRRRDLENYKRALLGLPPIEGGIEELVPSGLVCDELGFGRRTLGRRILSVLPDQGGEARDSA
jgi:hypothetical protein